MARRLTMLVAVTVLVALPVRADVTPIETGGHPPGPRAEMRGGIFTVPGSPDSGDRFIVVSGTKPDGSAARDALILDLMSKTWKKAPGDIPVEGPGIPGVGGHVFIPRVSEGSFVGAWNLFGGWQSADGTPRPMLWRSKISIFNNQDGSITLITEEGEVLGPAVPAPRWDHGGGAVKTGVSKVGTYISGGLGGPDKQYGFLKDTWIYDPETNTYVQMADLPGAMSGHEVIVEGSSVYSIGWGTEYPPGKIAVVRCDLETDTCEQIETFGNVPSARYDHRVIEAAPNLYVLMGGTDPASAATLSDIFLFNTTDMSWTNAGFSLPTGLAKFAAASVANLDKDGTAEIVVFGGAESWFTRTYSDTTYLVTVDLPKRPADIAVPAVARVRGAGAFFTSVMHLFNASSSDLEIEFMFTPRQGSGGEVTTTDHTVPAGVLETIEDPLDALFGFSGDAGGVGSILISVIAGSVDDLMVQTVVSARLDSGEQYGQLFPAMRVSDATDAGHTVYLNTTEDTQHNRVNVGLMAVADGTRFEVTPVDPLGNDLAPARTYDLAEGGNLQINNIHGVFGLGTTNNIVVEIKVVTGSGLGYASVLDGNLTYAGTSDPTTILPVSGGEPRIILLEIGSIQGRNEFSGSASITNYSNTEASVRADFMQRGIGGVTATETLVISAGRTLGFRDLANDLFTVSGDVGTVVFTPTNGTLIGATGREFAIFRDEGGEVIGTAGQLITGLTAADRLQPGVTHHLIGLREAGSGDRTERSHFATYNSTAVEVAVTARLYNGVDATFEGKKTWTIPPETLIQVNNVIAQINPQHDEAEKRLEIEVSRRVYLNAFRVNVWGDPVTLNPF